MSLQRKFSFLYTYIVTDENDMIGHIAYSLYKSNKIKYIEDFKTKKGQVPTEDDLEAYHNASKTTISALRIQAEQILSEFTELTLQASIDEIEKQMLSNQQEILTKIIKPIIPIPTKPKGHWDGFWMSVLVKGTQALVVALIFFLIIFGASAKDDFWGTIKKIIPESKHETHNNTVKDTIHH